MEQQDACLNVGSSGFGKSYIQGYDIEQKFRSGFFPIIIDKKLDHEKLGAQLGFKRLDIGKKTIDSWGAQEFNSLIEKLIKQGSAGIIFTFPDADFNISERDRVQVVNEIAKATLSLSTDAFFVLEEIRNFAPAQTNEREFNAVRTIINEGRSKDVAFGGTCQFPQQVHYKVFQAVQTYRVFGLGSGNSKYDKLSISQYREDMKGWTSDSRKYLLIDENKGIREVRSSKNVQRRTEHSG